jgi:HrpA-like RNA helicase
VFLIIYFRDILVFCTGQEEIESMIRAVNEAIPQLPAGNNSS